MLKKKYYIIYILFIFSLILSYFLKENSSGGSKYDFNYMYPYVEKFSQDLKQGFIFFFSNDGSKIHSPLFYILISLIFRLLNEIQYVNYVYLLISSTLPFIFYKILSLKFESDKNYLFIISLIIFLSPYFRSSAVWMTGENLSLVFFSLFIYFFIKSTQTNKLYDYVLSGLFIILCSYIRYYYCVFFLLLLINCFKNLSFKYLLYFVGFSFLISMPAFIYFVIIFFKYSFFSSLGVWGSFNYINNILTIYLIILIYLIPILFFKLKEVLDYYKKHYSVVLLFTFFLIFIFLIDHLYFKDLFYNTAVGGGVIKKLFGLAEIRSDYIYFFPILISCILLDFLLKEYRNYNYLIFLLIVLSFSLNILFQKYFDPLFILILFGLVKSELIENMLKYTQINLKVLFLYFSSFLVFANLYYYLI